MGTVCLITGYFVLLWGPLLPALFLRISGDLLLLPSALKLRLYDIVALQIMFATIDLTKITQLLTR